METTKIKIVSVENFEPGNGIEATAKLGEKTYRAYLQLPDCPDSEHSFLDEEGDDEELLQAIVKAVEEEYSSIDLTMLAEFGHSDFSHGYFYPEGYRSKFYVFVDESYDERHYLVESEYADYYNVFLLRPLNIEEENDEALTKELRDYEVTKD